MDFLFPLPLHAQDYESTEGNGEKLVIDMKPSIVYHVYFALVSSTPTMILLIPFIPLVSHSTTQLEYLNAIGYLRLVNNMRI
jgi:hypothetical protein